MLSLALLLGVTHAAIALALWVLYRSFIAVGQIWYGYGWELLLVEAGFVAIFACPLTSVGPLPRRAFALPLVWLYRWLAFRVMFGAGLIKLRGDSCWRDLTCLDFHFETQPLPNPLSPLFHALPHVVHAAGVTFNHLCELVLPFCLFAPRLVRMPAAVLMIVFQLTLIVSGNLSFLNWLTIVPLLAAFDDRTLARVLPARWAARAARPVLLPAPRAPVFALAAVVVLLSAAPIENMLSRRQRMNGAFEPLMLVNSYGAFGSVGRERRELVIEGTRDLEPSRSTRWLSYELPFKPGDPSARAAHRRAALPAPGLAAVVRGHVERRGRALAAQHGVEAAACRPRPAPLAGDTIHSAIGRRALSASCGTATSSRRADQTRPGRDSWKVTGCLRCPRTTSCATPSDSSAMRSKQPTLVAPMAVP